MIEDIQRCWRWMLILFIMITAFWIYGSACIKQDFCSSVAEEAKILEVLIPHWCHQILQATSEQKHFNLCSIFELSSHFVATTRHTCALPSSMKIMRLFDVRPLWAVMRGVECSGCMKALQSIWTMSDHYSAGPRHCGGLLTLWRSTEFNDGGNS